MPFIRRLAHQIVVFWDRFAELLNIQQFIDNRIGNYAYAIFNNYLIESELGKTVGMTDRSTTQIVYEIFQIPAPLSCRFKTTDEQNSFQKINGICRTMDILSAISAK